MTTLSAITAALVAALTTTLGTYDFTGADAVKTGSFASPPVGPFAAIETPAPRSVPWDTRQRKWLHTVTYTVQLWVPFALETLASRLTASTTVATYASAALQAARATSPALKLVNSFVVRATALDPTESELAPDWARATLTVEVVFVTSGGI